MRRRTRQYIPESFERSMLQQTMQFDTVDGQPLVMTRWRPHPWDKKRLTPIILLPGLGQNRYTWHLSRVSMVNFLVDRGMDVFVPELRGHGLSRMAGSKAPRAFSDYVFKDMPAIVDAVRSRAGYSKVFFCGHSLGGTIGYALDPSIDEFISGYIFIGGPSHFGMGLDLLRVASKVIDGPLVTTTQPAPGKTPKVATPFPVDLIGRGMRAGLKILNSPVNFLPYKLWYPGSIEEHDLKERVLLGFDRTSTAVVKLMVIWASRGRFVDEAGTDLFERNLRAKKAPALFITGDRDEVVPEKAMRPAFKMISSKDKTWKEFNIKETGVHWGHIDLIVGKRAPYEVWPYIADWIEAR